MKSWTFEKGSVCWLNYCVFAVCLLLLEVRLICESRVYEYWGDEYMCLMGVRGLDSVMVSIDDVGVPFFL